ncbi:hypothetical protein [Virgisporangium ochraceum]|nr:hypothetical protein [Virgisporangium ochraceum]
MATLRIEHAITDYDTWLRAFDSFGAARERAGVRQHHILRPVDDERYVSIDLDFDSVRAAEEFVSPSATAPTGALTPQGSRSPAGWRTPPRPPPPFRGT